MKRYRMSIGDIGCGPGLFSDEAPDGEWVHAEEVEAEIARLRSALVEALDLAERNIRGRDAGIARYPLDRGADDEAIARLRALASKEP